MSGVRLAALEAGALSVDEVLAAVADPTAGGLGLFVGVVRDHDGGRPVAGLTYSAHPSASAALTKACEQVLVGHDVVAAAAVHRVGELVVGEAAVVVAVSAAHRAEALAATTALIDTIKATVPIWKEQRYLDGSVDWVGVTG